MQWGQSTCRNGDVRCDLFNSIPNDVEEGWDPDSGPLGCDLPIVVDVICVL